MYLSIKIIAAILVIFLWFPCVVAAQNSAPSCKDLHNGIFYFYPKNSKDKYIDIRDDEYVHETNTTTGDTAVSKIKWINDCTFSLSFVSASGKTAETMATIMKKHTLVFQIITITNEYYVFKGYFDKTSNLPIQEDTIWLNEKVDVTNNELFTYLKDSALLAAQHISDTSKYALLYVYREGKLALSLSDYLVYLDNNILCVARNNSGYVFKVLKEGKFELKSRLLKDENAIQINVRFGTVYYVKSIIHWGMYTKLSNSKLENIIVSADEGKKNFDAIKFK